MFWSTFNPTMHQVCRHCTSRKRGEHLSVTIRIRKIEYCKSLNFAWDFFFVKISQMNYFHGIKYHANIFSAQTFWQCIITMINVTTTLSVTWIVAQGLNALELTSKVSTHLQVLDTLEPFTHVTRK